jgi:hypothetical protein
VKGGTIMKIILSCLVLTIVLTIPLFGLEAQKEKGFVLPLLLNTLIGFGLGSFIQGDITGGIIELSGDLFGGGLIIFVAPIVYLSEVLSTSGQAPAFTWNSTAGTLCIVGGCILLASRLFGIIRPIWYADDYNVKLKYTQVSFEISPGVLPALGRQNINLCLKFSLRVSLP